MSERTIPFRDLEEERSLFGSLDRNLHLLRRLYKVDAVSRGGVLKLTGDPESLSDAGRVVEEALGVLRSGRPVASGEVERIFRKGGVEDLAASDPTVVRPEVEPRSENQARYVEAIQRSTVTFGIGPAGTGKTFLAVAMAVAYLKRGTYRRIILCRPAVEAGESLGFLPGDMASKISPYLRPLYDALHALLPRTQLERYMEENVVEILPLAYMRGRTLDHAVIILDEAQNCTDGQMKMALTRLGRNSKMIVTGDITQVDLPQNRASGLVTARRILSGIDAVGFIHLSKADIVRHRVVADIIRAYARSEEGERGGARERLGARKDGPDKGPPRRHGKT
ncbi:MAG: phosphate starvation-inducible protein PhoH [Planctomycetes bacterium]|nr:phosphate starvation-inducible protein PhoH [Planctomycetota bacterium]